MNRIQEMMISVDKFYELNKEKVDDNRTYNTERKKKYSLKQRERIRKLLYYKRIFNNEVVKQQDKLYKERRRAFERLLPKNLTINEWKETLNFFNNSCALTNRNSFHMDHFIPLSTGHGGTIQGNVIPLFGELNESKKNINPFLWIKNKNDIDINKFNKVVEYLAKLNDLTITDFEDFVYWCFSNQRSKEQIKLDGNKTSLELWRESKLTYCLN